jgi:hypothetical protein
MKTDPHTAGTQRRYDIRTFIGALALVCVAVLSLPSATWCQTAQGETQRGTNHANKKTGVVRTLDAVNIEGEIAVPQVLFITSRDYRRYRDGMALKFRMSSLDVARSTNLPTRLRFVAKSKEEGQ